MTTIFAFFILEALWTAADVALLIPRRIREDHVSSAKQGWRCFHPRGWCMCHTLDGLVILFHLMACQG